MTIAFIADIHANMPALLAVERDIAASGADAVYCLGDAIGYGAEPRECLEFIRERQWPMILGNHEVAMFEPAYAENFNPYARIALHFSMGALGKELRQWLSTLPLTLETPLFQLSHGWSIGTRRFQYLLSEQDAMGLFSESLRPLVFMGHGHYHAVFHENPGHAGMTLSRDLQQTLAAGVKAAVNVGSVGQPRDHDARACWALYDDQLHAIEFRRVAYDAAQAAARIREAGLPQLLADRLLSGN